ncbi:MAG: hypothetical protein U0441_02860 [Polyangiaceae bacterium]
MTPPSAASRDLPSSGPWSTEAALLVRPFRTYRELAKLRDRRTWRDLARGVAIEMTLLGGFVSITSAGRMVLAHVVFTALFWGFLPALQIGAIFAAVRVAAPRERIAAAASLYFEGLGPWYVFFLALPAVCLLSPDVYGTMTTLLRVGALPAYLLATIVWGGVITWAFFREGLGLTRGRAALGSAVFYVIFVGVVVGYYLACNEIQPQIVGTSR